MERSFHGKARCRVERGSTLAARRQPDESILFCFRGQSGDLARLDGHS